MYRAVAAGLAVSLRVTPNAAQARIDGIVTEADGASYLKLAVGAPPEDGKANEVVVKLLAKTWGLPKSAFAITAGARDRRKTLTIAGDPRLLETKLAAWLKPHQAA